MHFNEMAMPP